MELRHEFTVPVPVEEAWPALLDIERVAPCMPGATVEDYDGETIRGSVKVKVGPITVTYKGTAAFEERDEDKHRIVLAANAKEARGQGTVRATVTGSLEPGEDGTTAVTVVTDLTVTGRPAQFGRGVMADVGQRIVGRFSDCLAKKLTGPEPVPEPEAATSEAATSSEPATPPAPAPATTQPAPPTTRPAREPTPEAEPLDLLEAAGGPVAKRAALAAAALAAGAALFSVVRRLARRRGRRH